MNTLEECREHIEEYILNSTWASGIENPLMDWDIEGAAWDLRAAYDAAGVDLDSLPGDLDSAIERSDIINDVLQRIRTARCPRADGPRRRCSLPSKGIAGKTGSNTPPYI